MDVGRKIETLEVREEVSGLVGPAPLRALRSLAVFARKESAREKRDTFAQSSPSTAKLAKLTQHGHGGDAPLCMKRLPAIQGFLITSNTGYREASG